MRQRSIIKIGATSDQRRRENNEEGGRKVKRKQMLNNVEKQEYCGELENARKKKMIKYENGKN